MHDESDLRRDISSLPPHLREKWERVQARAEQLRVMGRMRLAREQQRQRRRYYRLHSFGVAGLTVVAGFADLLNGTGWLWLMVPAGVVYLYFAWRWLLGHNPAIAWQREQMQAVLDKEKKDAKNA